MRLLKSAWAWFTERDLTRGFSVSALAFWKVLTEPNVRSESVKFGLMTLWADEPHKSY